MLLCSSHLQPASFIDLSLSDALRAQVQEGEPGEAVHGHHQERGWKKGERGDRRGAAQVDLGQERRAQPDPRVMAEVRQGH
jgi:hypothetical protein